MRPLFWIKRVMKFGRETIGLKSLR
ncbi:UNVERIFIED_CONTAM: hypothetical protein GTU68_002781 [Idotea baltica]|nr:hypothetical protein [Idotea baltica]